MAKTSENTGILGGTFDPVHQGHLSLAQQICRQLDLCQVWFIPAWRSPHKQDRTPADAGHRVNMLSLALAPYPRFQVSEIELERKKVSYTIDTLDTLKSRHSEKEWTLILGMDTFQDFRSWKNAGEILRKAHLAVATRPGCPAAPLQETLDDLSADFGLTWQSLPSPGKTQTFLCRESNTKISFCDIEPVEVSSRAIREALRLGRSLKKMLPPEVEGYIIKHLLYQANPQPLSE